MLRFHPSWLSWLLVLTLWLCSASAQAEEFYYRYVSIEQALSAGFLFFEPVAINDAGRVYGVTYDCATTDCGELIPHIAVYADEAVTVLHPELPGIAHTANERDMIGGSVEIDRVNFLEQAALFHHDQVEFVPPQPGELTSFVTALNDYGVALVTSFDTLFQPTYVLYKNGQATPQDFGLTVTQPFEFLQINNQRIISGTAFNLPGLRDRCFRFDTRTGETTLLDPLPTEPRSWAVGINNRGDVLGYSFVASGIERIGVWDHDAEFKTYFVEGTPEFPTISNSLRFNDNNLIVITLVTQPASELGNSYLVPEPGVRLNLADMAENLPSGQDLSAIVAVNNHGDMTGAGSQGAFLLERLGCFASFGTPPE